MLITFRISFGGNQMFKKKTQKPQKVGTHAAAITKYHCIQKYRIIIFIVFIIIPYSTRTISKFKTQWLLTLQQLPVEERNVSVYNTDIGIIKTYYASDEVS